MAVFYPYQKSFPTGLVLISVFVLALITLAAVRFRRRHPYLITGWCWYLITLAPVSGLIQVGAHSRGDRYTYVPLIGIFMVVAWGVAQNTGPRRRSRRLLAATGIAFLTGLLVVANVQTSHWRDSIALWKHTLACTSQNDFAHHNLGTALTQQGNLPEAIHHFERAIEIDPNNADTHLNLGIALGNQGNTDSAIPHFERALALQPKLPQAYNNLGIALLAKGKSDEAARHFERAIELRPDFAEAHYYLGLAMDIQGKKDAAVQHFGQALNMATAQGNLALANSIRVQLQSIQTPLPQPKAP